MIKTKKLETKKEFEEVLKLDLKLLEFEASVDEGLKIPDEEIKKYEKDFFEQKFEEMKKSNALFLIAKSNNKVIGYALGWVQKIDLNHKINEEGYICNVYVLDEYRKQKIGKLLTDNLIKWFKEKGIKRAVLDITEKNKLGLNFWERYGFGLHPFRRMCLDL